MSEEVDLMIQPTPNPNALKFIINTIVKSSGKSTYRSIDDVKGNELARLLFELEGVDQLHFYQNVITVSKFSYKDWEELEPAIIELLKEEIPKHDPDFIDISPETERRAHLSPELQKIEEILDKKIRPGLQGDGGDLQCLSFEDNVLIVKYEGACGTCPSSTMGTLEAIRAILRDDFEPNIEVYAAPPENDPYFGGGSPYPSF